MKTLLKSGTVVFPDGCRKSDILIENEMIREIGEDLPEDDCAVTDVSGCFLFPGFIDPHTHFELDNGTVVSPDDFYWGTRAAVLGGTTSIVDFATQKRGESAEKTLQDWHRKADGNCSCDYGFHMSFTEWNPSLSREVSLMAAEGVTSFKLYMAYDNLRVNDGEIYEILKRVGEIGGIVGTHCESGDLVNALSAELKAEGRVTAEAHPLSRPDLVEADAVRRYLDAAKLAGQPVSIVHLSSKRGLEEVRRARKEGQEVYVETCPQYLLLDDSRYSLKGVEGAKYVISPPLRKKEDCRALWEALRQGEIDTVATDQCSFTLEQKAIGLRDFSRIPGGIPGVQDRPALIYTYGVLTGMVTLEQMAAVLSENAAKEFGMYPAKGVLRPGSDADITVWDPEYHGVISAASQAHHVDNTPYEGVKVTGRPLHVFLRGHQVVKNGSIALEKCGRYLRRHSCSFFRGQEKNSGH